jgi:hypothetical protein
MLKEVDCLPMVKPDAASHLGIRHVYVSDFHYGEKGGSHLGCARMGNEVMPFAGSTFDGGHLKTWKGMMNSTS